MDLLAVTDPYTPSSVEIQQMRTVYPSFDGGLGGVVHLRIDLGHILHQPEFVVVETPAAELLRHEAIPCSSYVL